MFTAVRLHDLDGVTVFDVRKKEIRMRKALLIATLVCLTSLTASALLLVHAKYEQGSK